MQLAWFRSTKDMSVLMEGVDKKDEMVEMLVDVIKVVEGVHRHGQVWGGSAFWKVLHEQGCFPDAHSCEEDRKREVGGDIIVGEEVTEDNEEEIKEDNEEVKVDKEQEEDLNEEVTKKEEEPKVVKERQEKDSIPHQVKEVIDNQEGEMDEAGELEVEDEVDVVTSTKKKPSLEKEHLLIKQESRYQPLTKTILFSPRIGLDAI